MDTKVIYHLCFYLAINYLIFFTAFMIVTQIFFTLCFICVLISLILVLIFFLCFGPEQKYFVLLTLIISGLLVTAGK